MSNLQVGAPMPGSIGQCADEYHRVRELRLAMQKEVDAVKARESEIEDYIINNLSKSQDTGAAGRYYRAQIVRKEVPKLVDFHAALDYAVRNQRYDLIQKRVNNTAVAAMWEAGEAVPGVDKMHVVDVSITKL